MFSKVEKTKAAKKEGEKAGKEDESNGSKCGEAHRDLKSERRGRIQLPQRTFN